MDECGYAATQPAGLRKPSFHLSHGFLLFIATLAILLMVATPILAQSDLRPRKLNFPSASGNATRAEQISFFQGSSNPANPQPDAKEELLVDTSAPEGDPVNGKQLLQSVGCADCHGRDAEGATGPPLINLRETFQQFESQVRKPIGAMPNQFPPDLVSEDKLIDIYAFLEHPPGSSSDAKVESSANNSKPKPDAENGKKLFTSQGCDKCHALGQQGGAASEQLNAIPDSLRGLIDYVRHPKGQMPPFTVTAISDKELADIYAYMKSRPKP